MGIVLHKKVGDYVSSGEPLATVYYNAEARASQAKQLLQKSYQVADSPHVDKRPLIHRVIRKSGDIN